MHRFVAALAAALLCVAPFLTITPSGADSYTVVVDASGVHPADLAVPEGASVVFRNEDGQRHRLRADADGARFDTGDIEPGGRVTVPFTAEGTYAYVDERTDDDARYSGRVVVGSTAPTPSGGSSTPPTPSGTAAPTSATVSVRDRIFSPSEVRIAVGGNVAWTNSDDRAHTATSNDGSFDSGSVATGGRFSHRFAAPGTFPYRCDFHPDMTGTVVVAPTDGSTPPPPASPSGGTTPSPSRTQASAPPGTPKASLRVEDFRFLPPSLTVATGTVIEVTNAGRAAHTATAAGHFDTGIIRTGANASFLVGRPGTFPYTCLVHPDMKGTVVVTGVPIADDRAAQTEGDVARLESAGDAPPQPAAPAMASVEIQDFAFAPAEVAIVRGGSVTWTNRGVAPHTVSGVGLESGLLEPGDTYRRTFDRTGTFRYKCEFHPQMTGAVRVVNAAGSSTDEAPTPSPRQLPQTTTASIASGPSSRNGVALAGAGVILAGTGLLLYGAKRFMSAA